MNRIGFNTCGGLAQIINISGGIDGVTRNQDETAPQRSDRMLGFGDIMGIETWRSNLSGKYRRVV
jgi:hypothetical protein